MICYVCASVLPIKPPEFPGDDGQGEDGRPVCDLCQARAYEAVDEATNWPSSEDQDLRLVNCAIEALRKQRVYILTAHLGLVPLTNTDGRY